jgi:hypothetical protein
MPSSRNKQKKKQTYRKYEKYGQTITVSYPPARINIKKRGCKTVKGTFYDDGSLLFETFDATRNLTKEAKQWIRRAVDELIQLVNDKQQS